MIRLLDVVLSLAGLIVLWPLMLFALVAGFIDTRSPIFVQERIGLNKKTFKLVKFRTMLPSTKSVASHLATRTSITSLGRFLRTTKIDELPQLINVLKGEMSIVGPRPNLCNQEELIEEREKLGVYNVVPGITGLAQVKKIDMSTPKLLAKTDKEMIDSLTAASYLKYICMTIVGQGTVTPSSNISTYPMFKELFISINEC